MKWFTRQQLWELWFLASLVILIVLFVLGIDVDKEIIPYWDYCFIAGAMNFIISIAVGHLGNSDED